MTKDETSAILKHSEHIEKFQDQSVVLEDELITKAENIPQDLSKNMQFFHKGKSGNDGSKIHTNICAMYSEDTITIRDDLNHELEEEEDITLGLQRVQHHNKVKIGRVLGMMEKINLKPWID